STSTDRTVTYDAIAPTVTINQAATQADPTNGSPIHFRVVFSEPVTGFGTAGITLGGTATPSSDTVSLVSGSTYDVAVSGMSSPGSVIASVIAGAAHDAAGNTNTSSTSTDNAVSFQSTVGLVVQINQAATQTDPARASPI